MTPTTSSEPSFTAADYIEYLRCPRTAHLRLTGEWPNEPVTFPVPSDRDEVRAHAVAHLRFPQGASFDRWFADAPFIAHADVWHRQKPEGFASVLIREASSLKQAYLIESMFIRMCAGASGELPARQFVYHLDKHYEHSPDRNPATLYIAADVTRRSRIMLREHEKRLGELRDQLAADPFLEAYRNRPCDRAHSCPVCSLGRPEVPDWHITTLYRGGELVSTLAEQGYNNIVHVPEDLLPHPRQRIQQRTLATGEPHVDSDGLEGFIDGLVYPLHYLDFEAVSSAIPRHPGTRPWEHVPYLFSVHTEPAPGASLDHHALAMKPGKDERRQLIDALVGALSGPGGVVVYGAPFESGVLARLARDFPERAEEIEDIRSRIVDLLTPFKEFLYYDSRQRGRASLKTVLRVFSEDIYHGLPVRDGYHANIAFRYLERLADGGPGAASAGQPEGASGWFGLEPGKIVDALVQYCTMDTLAMVKIVATLREIAGASRPA